MGTAAFCIQHLSHFKLRRMRMLPNFCNGLACVKVVQTLRPAFYRVYHPLHEERFASDMQPNRVVVWFW